MADSVAVLLQLALARAQSMGEQALIGLGVNGREYGILAVLSGGGSSVQHRVGAALGIDRTTTMKLLAGLEARGLVQRSRDPGNRRAYRVRITSDGDRVREQASRRLAGCEERLLASLESDEREHLRSLLYRLL